jgi:methylthioxylose transferase
MTATRDDIERGSRATEAAPLRPRRHTATLPLLTLAAGAGLIIGSERWGRHLQAAGTRLYLNAPPLAGSVDPRLPLATLLVVAFAGLMLWRGSELSATIRIRSLPWLAFLAAGAWAGLLAFTDGIGGITGPPARPAEYLHDVARVGAVGPFLHGFVANIGSYTTHVRAHPPGMILILWGLAKAGLNGPGAVAALELLGGAAAVPAVILALRELAGEERARAATPFLILAPFAVMFGSGDALFMGVGAWASAALILATGKTGRARTAWAIAGGCLLAAGLMLSYGMTLVALIPAFVIVRRKRLDVGLLALAPIAATLAAFAAAGFWWFYGLTATRHQYAESIARFRPDRYFLVANLAALAVAIGPVVWVGLVRLRDRRVWLVTGAAVAAIALADLSGLSKGEVERIWLPFMPWLLVGGAIGLRARPHEQTRWSAVGTARAGLAVQIVWALGLQLLVRSPW